MIAGLLTPIPGFPVSRIRSTPISAARFAFSTVALRPGDIFHMGSVSPSSPSFTGSRLIPTGLPVSFFMSRTVFSGSVFGSPFTTGFITSNILSSTTSAPMAATNSALVTFPSMGCSVPMVSQAIIRPSLFKMDSRRSSFVNF